MDDLMIIELYFVRNEQAIKETDIKYGKLCFNVASNILCNNEDSEECVNDTYLSVWNKIPPTRPNNFMVFICKIVRNLSIKKLDFNLALRRTQNVTVSFIISLILSVTLQNDTHLQKAKSKTCCITLVTS